MNHNFCAEYDNVRIRPLYQEDIENLRVWRNNTQQTRFLRPIGTITREMQEKWFEKYLENPFEIVFAIEEICDLNRMVGSLALYDIKENVAEIGKIQIGDPEASGRGIGRKSLVMAMKIGFELLRLKKIIASVHQDNITARTNDLRIGFEIVGEHESVVGGIEDELEIDYEKLRLVNSYVDDIKTEK